MQMEKREKKTSEPEIIKILYTRATVTVYISTVTVVRSEERRVGKELDIFKRLLLLFFSNWLFHSLSILFY